MHWVPIFIGNNNYTCFGQSFCPSSGASQPYNGTDTVYAARWPSATRIRTELRWFYLQRNSIIRESSREEFQINTYGQNLQKMGCSHFRKQLIWFIYICTTTVWTCFTKPEGHTFNCSEVVQLSLAVPKDMCSGDVRTFSTLRPMCHVCLKLT
jgi:hypothetical protein